VEAPAVVVLVLLALLLGAAFGAWCAWPPRPTAEDLAPTPPARPVPLPPAPHHLGLSGRFLPRGQLLALALEETPLRAEQMAELLAHHAADHWQLGVVEMRDALVTSSGLSPALVDHMATLAILALEARHAPKAQHRR
jgi:hypothetical protein